MDGSGADLAATGGAGRVDPDIVHHLRTIEACEDRVLRVLYNEAVSPVRIVSVFLDRRMKGKL